MQYSLKTLILVKKYFTNSKKSYFFTIKMRRYGEYKVVFTHIFTCFKPCFTREGAYILRVKSSCSFAH